MGWTVGSLFSGIGGLDLGFHRAGFEVRWFCEADPFCRAVLAKHWPGVPCYEDVRTFHAPSRVDVLLGSCPCQPFSSASRGRKLGAADDRWLWYAMRRVIAEARPRVVVSENVAQFDGVALEQMVADLESDGYEVPAVLEIPACATGHDHWRPRLWVLGYADRDREPGLPIHAKASGVSRGGGERVGVPAAHGLPPGLPRWRRAALQAIGNAVVPQVAEIVARRVREILETA